MGDEAELGPALKGSVPTLDLLENWHLFESPAGARYTSFRRRQAQWPSFASSPWTQRQQGRLTVMVPYLSQRRALRTSSATKTAALGAQGLSSHPSTTSYSSPNYRTAARAWRLLRRVDERPSGSRRALPSMPDRCAQVGARCANLAKRACVPRWRRGSVASSPCAPDR